MSTWTTMRWLTVVLCEDIAKASSLLTSSSSWLSPAKTRFHVDKDNNELKKFQEHIFRILSVYSVFECRHFGFRGVCLYLGESWESVFANWCVSGWGGSKFPKAKAGQRAQIWSKGPKARQLEIGAHFYISIFLTWWWSHVYICGVGFYVHLVKNFSHLSEEI